MDWRVVAFVGGALALVVGLFLFFGLGYAQATIQFFLARPFWLVALVSLLVLIAAIKSGRPMVSLMMFGFFLISLGVDFLYPPISRVCTEPNALLAVSFVDQFPESAFASDSAFCKVFIQSFGSFLIYQQNFSPPTPIFWLLIPFLVLGILVFTGLAYLDSRFWAGVFILLGYLFISVLLFQNQTIGQINITLAGLIAYGILAPLIVASGVFATFFAAERLN